MRGASEAALQVHNPGYEVGCAPRGESKRRGASSEEGLPRCEGRRAQVGTGGEGAGQEGA